MAGRPLGKLVKSKSQELILDDMEPSSPSSAFSAKMRKVFGSSPIMKKKSRTTSLNTSLGNSKAFGVPLAQLLTPQPSDPRKLSLPVGGHRGGLTTTIRKIPPVVVKIVNHIEKHGLDQEGIYRINGNNKLVERLRITFNETGDADLINTDIYSIGSLLKLFLRQLPTPLVPDDVSQKVIELQESLTGRSYTADNSVKLKAILAILPSDNYRLLKYLCNHLHLVAEHTDKNKMTSVSLSIVFGPNVFRCGGELIDLKNQGYANAAFAVMIQNHETIFDDNKVDEEDELKTVSAISDDVFLDDDTTSKRRNKPVVPKPYHEHVQLKNPKRTTSISSQGSMSLPSSPSHAITVTGDDQEPLVSPTSERSIDEAISEYEEMKKQSQTTSSVPIPAKLVRNKSLSDDVLTNRGPSPSSWNSKTSPYTSPSSSPVVTPRTTQAYTTLLGDSIQDNLFPEDSHHLVSSTEDICTTTTDTEIPYQVLPSSSSVESTKTGPSTSNESVQSREVNFRRRNNAMRNRKSAVYGSDSSLEITSHNKRTNEDDELIQLLTVDESSHVINTQEFELKHDDGNEETDNGQEETKLSAKSIRDKFEKQGTLLQFAGKNTPIKPYLAKDTSTPPVASSAPPPVAKKPQRKSTGEQTLNNYVSHDFDHVTEKVKTLTNITKQRVRGPSNRAKPSRSTNSLLNNENVDGLSITQKDDSSSIEVVDTELPLITEETDGPTPTTSNNQVISDSHDSLVPSSDANSAVSCQANIILTNSVTDTVPLITQMTPQMTSITEGSSPITQVITTFTTEVTPSPVAQVMATPTITSTDVIPKVILPITKVAVSPPIAETTPSITKVIPPIAQVTETPPITQATVAPPITQATVVPSITKVIPPHTELTPHITQVTTAPIITQKIIPPITKVTVAPPITDLTPPYTKVIPPITEITKVTVAPPITDLIPPYTKVIPPITKVTPPLTDVTPHNTRVTETSSLTDTAVIPPSVMTVPHIVQLTSSPIHSKVVPHDTIVSPIRATTITSPSRMSTSIMSPSHDNIPTKVTKTQQVGPVDKVSMVPAGWTTTDHDDYSQYSYEELITEAKKLKYIIKVFYQNFMAKNGRNPFDAEASPMESVNSSLTIIKKKLRALRSSQRDSLNKTAPSQLTAKVTTTVHVEEPLASLSAVKIDETPEKKTDSTLRRHQSLSISTSHSKNSAFSLIIQSIEKSLDEKREQADRPKDLHVMTYDQLMQEKHLIQKTLLQFEKKHGRPQSSDGKTIMKPLYNRYREIKKILSSQEKTDRQDNTVSPPPTTTTTGDRSLWSVTMLPVSPLPSTSADPPITPLVGPPITPSAVPPITPSAVPPITPSAVPPITPSAGPSSLAPVSPLSTKEKVHQPAATYQQIKPTQQQGVKLASYPSTDATTTNPQSNAVLMSKRGRVISATTVSEMTRELPQGVRKVYSKSVSTSQVPSQKWMSEEQLTTASLTELEEQLAITQTRKKEQRQQLRSFEINFQEKEKRPVQNADKKKLMHNEYTQYKMLKNRLSLLDALMLKQKGY